MADFAAVLNGEPHSAADAEALAKTLRAAEADAEAAFRAKVEAAIKGKSEGDAEAVADSTGLPLIDIRAAMADARRGNPSA